jgi:hypothetical protein
MSINVIERNDSDCKYVEIFTHRVGSIGAPSRSTVFIRGTNTKQLAVPNNNNNNNNNNNIIIIIITIQFSSIFACIRANVTAQRPITK